MAELNYKELLFRPGIDKTTTEYAAEGAWVDSDKVRFRQGRPEKIGGWAKEQVKRAYGDTTQTTFEGIARETMSWSDLESQDYLAVGTHKKLNVLFKSEIHDITPIEVTTTVNSAINTSVGSTEVLVCIDSHGRQVGDYLEFSSVGSTVGGIYLDGQYVVTSAPTADSVIIDTGTTAAATSTGAGGDATVFSLLGTGKRDNSQSFGWGAGTWGTPGASVSAGWSQPRGSGVATQLRLWSLAQWGEDLLANPRGGKVYYWNTSVGVSERATLVTAAPSAVNHILVDDSARNTIALGCTDITGKFDPMLVRWADSEDFTDWVPTSVNTAGDYRLTYGSEIKAGVKTKREVIILTDTAAVAMRFTGGSFVYRFDTLATKCGLVAPKAMVNVNGVVFWWGEKNFYLYDGSVRILPCSMHKYIFDSEEGGAINEDQREKIAAKVNSQFSEITWYYPGKASLENDRYITYNYAEDTWYGGTIGRTTWEDVGIFDRPYGLGYDTSVENAVLFVHEEGKNDDASPMKAYIQSSYFDLGAGDSMMFCDNLLPDIALPTNKNLNFTLKTRRKGFGSSVVTKGPYSIGVNTDLVNLRARGRQGSVCFSTSITDGDFEIGKCRLNLVPDGGR
jgi:hypothetical protein